MLKKLSLLMLALAGIAQAQTTTPTANSWEARFRNEINNGVYVYYIVPDGSGDQVATYNGSTNKPEYSKLGTGLQRSGNTLSVLLNASDINGVTSVGQSLMTATDAATARAAIGAGTGSGFSGAYADLTGIPSTFTPAAHTQAWSTITGTPTTRSGYGITDAYPLTGNPSGFITGITSGMVTTALGFTPGTVTSVTAGTGLSGGTITTSGTISLPNIGTASSYSGVTTDAQGRVSAGTNRSFAYQTRALNTCFQVSSTRDAMVAYAVEIVTVSTLVSGQAGTVFLETFTNSGCTTGTQEIMRFSNGNIQSLGLSVTMTQTVTGTLNGIVPAGLWIKLRTNNDTGTPAFNARPGQEVLM